MRWSKRAVLAAALVGCPAPALAQVVGHPLEVSGGAAGAAPSSTIVAAARGTSAPRTPQPPRTRARLRIVGPPLPSFLLCMGWPLPQFGIG